EPFTVFDIISESDDHLTLQAAIEIAGLDGILSDPNGTFTVFAPTDDAFDAIDPEVLEAILDDEELLTAILLYHVVGAIAFSSDLEDGQEIETALGQNVTVTIENGNVFINNALVTVADLEADNGVVHVIDAVLLPEVDEPFTVFDIISESDDHLTLQAAIEIAGLDGILSDPNGTFTVFAPTDDAFDAIDPEVLEAILDDEELLTAILLYHVVGAIAFSSDLEDGQEIETALGQNVTVTIENGNVFINNALVTVADLEADNGVVHVIDAVLLPQLGPCVEFVGGPYGNFNAEPFNGAPTPGPDGTCPVFQLPFEAWASELYVVENFQEGVEYTFSICEGPNAGSWEPELTIFNADGQLVTFVQDCEITWTATYTGTYLIGINEVGACGDASDNLETDNGFPTLSCTGVELPETVWDIVVGSDVHNTLEAAINAAGLVETLQGEGPFTLFAPTDDAFDALPEGLLEALLDDPDGDLTSVLLYHVLSGQVLSTDLSDGMEATTVLGQDILVTIENGNVFINDAQVIVADILAGNGVVHVINAVLVPDLNTTRNLDVIDISIYPNPVSDYLQLDLPSELLNNEVTIEVINIQGQTVQQFRFNGNAEKLNVSNLPAGTYLLNIISDHFIGRDRFIKQ
ncbi:MAG: T9SS C-terminal target domain-containing protein, partial [Saprospirales bacterium]